MPEKPDWIRWLERKSAREASIAPPIALGTRSNGEHLHLERPIERRIRALVMAKAEESARRLGIDRRTFLASAAGMATSLWAVKIAGCGERIASGVDAGMIDANGPRIPDGATLDAAWACEVLDTSPFFVFDVQSHHMDPDGPWRTTNPGWESFAAFLPQSRCGLPDSIECFSAQRYIEEMFLDSDTHVAVLTTVPAALCEGGDTTDCGSPLPNEEIVATRELVNGLAGSQRLLNHAMIMPNLGLASALATMDRLASESGVAAWKCYPPWGPSGSGWSLADPAIGLPFVEHGIALGVPIFCIHKGLPLPGFDPVHTDPRDVVEVATMFPAGRFVVYHSAYNHGAAGFGSDVIEGPYDPTGSPGTARLGINSLISAMQDRGVAPGSNVYAELGSTWQSVMTSPDEAAHAIGKLLRWVGEDNILWGTDCIWYGSPQPQIEAFRTFAISTELQDRFGYPALTDERKAKILGRNAARLYGIDPDARRCAIDRGALATARRTLDGSLGDRRWAFTLPAGPRSRREMLSFLRHRAGMPG
jgi:predicted TIM-barrel fold metal-dependent hydrolase